MDDLLSAALEEAGLSEYLSEPNSPAPPSSQEVPGPHPATSEAFHQDASQQHQFLPSNGHGVNFDLPADDGSGHYAMPNNNGATYQNFEYQQPMDMQYVENDQMDFGFGSTLTSSASAPVIDDPTNELNYFFSELPQSFMAASTSQAQQQPNYAEPIAPIDTSASLDASPSPRYITPTFELDSPSSSAFSSPSENSDPATTAQTVRAQNTPSPVVRTHVPSSMSGKVVSQPGTSVGQKVATKAKLVTTAKGQQYLVDKDGRKIEAFTKVVRANGEVVSTATGQIAPRGAANGSPAVIRQIGADGQARLISGNQKMVYVMRETEDGQQQATPARVVRLPDGRLVARTVTSRPGSPVVVSVNGNQGGLLVRRRMSTPNLVGLEGQPRKVSVSSVRNSMNPSTPYVAIDGEHMIVTPPESSANSPVPSNETKYVPVNNAGSRHQFIRTTTTTSGGRQLVVSRPGVTSGGVKGLSQRASRGSLDNTAGGTTLPESAPEALLSEGSLLSTPGRTTSR
uniref:BZIP domain-containing protein n=1 Tax=Steinernema glaseri TaxID=37863 RepID=A0A1I7Z1G3_9BILA